MAVAYVAKDHEAHVISYGTIGTRHADMDHLTRKLQSKAQRLGFVYAAGPWGSWLYRDLSKTGYAWWVVAPSFMPQKPGDRVTTDRHDAMQGARLMRSGALTPVSVPTVAEEALRALCRAREEALCALQAAKVHLQAFLLRHDRRYTDQATGGPAHLRWLSAVVWATPAHPLVLQEDVRAVSDHTEHLQRLAQALHEQVQTWRLQPVVEALPGLRGVPCTVAVTPGAERGDLTRFAHPRQLMKYLGLIPAEYSSGERRRQGAISQAGPTPARHALVAGAWAYRYPAKVSRHLQLRLAQLPKPIPALSGKAQGRLCTRSRRLSARGKNANQVVVAIARELGGFMGAIAQEVPVTPSSSQTTRHGTHKAAGFPRAWQEAPPRCGGTLDSGTRPSGMLVLSVRQAPDGRTEGGHPSTASSRINRCMVLAPALVMHEGQKQHADVNTAAPTLDSRSHINAGLELRPTGDKRRN
jgi:transposase